MLPPTGQPDPAIEAVDDNPEVQGIQILGGRPHRGELAQAEDAIQEVKAQLRKQGSACIVALDPIEPAEAEFAAPNAPELSESNFSC